ncbi:unnamed protein product [marine sediment metagenome]|uniref:Uncharacterized protein n=1 Tax=marine sediment metagenome TaxID=412755 RepID=X1BQP0_9ZZZZ
MKIVVTPKELEKVNGIEISVTGYKADPSTTEPIQVYIEVYNGLLRVHTWTGEQDPKTVEIEKDTEGLWQS